MAKKESQSTQSPCIVYYAQHQPVVQCMYNMLLHALFFNTAIDKRGIIDSIGHDRPAPDMASVGRHPTHTHHIGSLDLHNKYNTAHLTCEQ